MTTETRTVEELCDVIAEMEVKCPTEGGYRQGGEHDLACVCHGTGKVARFPWSRRVVAFRGTHEVLWPLHPPVMAQKCREQKEFDRLEHVNGGYNASFIYPDGLSWSHFAEDETAATLRAFVRMVEKE